MSQLLLTAKTARRLLKEEGPRALLRRYGWRFVAGVFCYYLLRDLTIYVMVPALVMKLSGT